jgi:predicted metalloprotease
MALWPAAQRLRFRRRGSEVPVRTPGTKSAHSTQEYAELKTLGSTRRQWKILLQNHSEEYVPPHLARYSGCSRAARAVISAASAWPVWSFHSQAWAFGFLFRLG